MGSKGGSYTTLPTMQSSTSTSSVTPNPTALAAYNDVISRGQSAAATPYTPYGGQLVQGFSGDQTGAFGTVDALQGAADPYIDQATSLAQFAATGADPANYATNVASYMSPYTQDVVDATRANMREDDANAQNGIVSNAIAQGAMGGDRVGVTQAELARKQSLSDNATIAGLYNQGYTNAQGQLNTSLGQAAQGSYGLGALGQEKMSTGLSGAQAQLQTGGLQQQLGQAQLSTAYQQYLLGQAYPYQQTSWLSGIVNGTGPNMGSSSVGTNLGYGTTSQANPSVAGQAIGGLTALAGMFLRDGGRVKKAGGGGLGGIADVTGGTFGTAGFIPQAPQITARGLVLPPAPQLPNAKGGGGGSAGASSLPGLKIPAGAANKIKGGLGNLFDGGYAASMPDTSFGDFGGLYARGGGVPGGFGHLRRGYADGGSPMADDGGYTPDLDVVVPGLGDLPDDAGGFSALAPADDDGGFGRIIKQESGGKQFGADGQPLTSSKGATGIAQVMPTTGPEAAGLAGLPWDEDKFKNDAGYNRALGKAYYQRQLDDFGDHEKAAAAYNAGPGRLSQALARADKEGGDWRSYLPAETRDYIAKVAPRNGDGAGALSYDGSDAQPASGGFGAISSAVKDATGFGGLSEGRSADDGSGSGSRSGLLGLNFSPETRQALMAAGFGMLASKSPHVGNAIGEGGLAGLAQYQQSQGLGLKRAQLGNQTRNVDSEINARTGNLSIADRAQTLQERAQQARIDAAKDAARAIGAPTDDAQPSSRSPVGASPSGAGAPPTVARPSVTPTAPDGAGTSAPGDDYAPATADRTAGAAPQPATSQPALSRQSDPAYLDRMADRYERAAIAAAASPEVQKNYATTAQSYRNAARQIQSSGRGIDANGRVIPLPGSLDTESASEGAKTSARMAAEAPYKFKEVAPTPGGPTYFVSEADIGGHGQPQRIVSGPGAGSPASGSPPPNAMIAKQPAFIATKQEELAKNENTMGDQYKNRAIALERLQTLADIQSKYQTGAFAEHKADFVSALRSVGIDAPNTATANPAKFQEFTKNAVANIFAQAKDLGGRILVSEIAGLTKANANAEMQPEANKAIIGQAMGLLNYENQYHDDYFDWKRANPYAYDASNFDQQWTKDHPVSGFTKSATREIGARGEQIPAAAERTVGQVYANGAGKKARWTGKGWENAP